MDKPVCKHCKVIMEWRENEAIFETMVMGVPDFPGNTENSRGQTVYAGGPGKLGNCWKCPKCGWSMT